MKPRPLTLITTLLCLTACGQKGPLYLPESQEGIAITQETSVQTDIQGRQDENPQTEHLTDSRSNQDK